MTVLPLPLGVPAPAKATAPSARATTAGSDAPAEDFAGTLANTLEEALGAALDEMPRDATGQRKPAAKAGEAPADDAGVALLLLIPPAMQVAVATPVQTAPAQIAVAFVPSKAAPPGMVPNPGAPPPAPADPGDLRSALAADLEAKLAATAGSTTATVIETGPLSVRPTGAAAPAQITPVALIGVRAEGPAPATVEIAVPESATVAVAVAGGAAVIAVEAPGVRSGPGAAPTAAQPQGAPAPTGPGPTAPVGPPPVTGRPVVVARQGAGSPAAPPVAVPGAAAAMTTGVRADQAASALPDAAAPNMPAVPGATAATGALAAATRPVVAAPATAAAEPLAPAQAPAPVQTPAQAPVQAPAQTSIQAPAQTSAHASAQTSAQTFAQALAPALASATAQPMPAADPVVAAVVPGAVAAAPATASAPVETPAAAGAPGTAAPVTFQQSAFQQSVFQQDTFQQGNFQPGDGRPGSQQPGGNQQGTAAPAGPVLPAAPVAPRPVATGPADDAPASDPGAGRPVVADAAAVLAPPAHRADPAIVPDAAQSVVPGVAVNAAPNAVPVTAPTTPAPAVPQPAPTGADGWGSVAPQLVSVLSPLRRGPDGVHRMTLRLQPENLGPISVVAEVRNGTIAVQLRADREAGQAALQAALPQLRQDLTDAGFAGCALDLHQQDSPAGNQSQHFSGWQPEGRSQRRTPEGGQTFTTEPPAPVDDGLVDVQL
ncbi:flagellar hook-length control protein FliK [Dactylosporangium sp. NPDC051485]|uniref:flagellar hook-length control protein FliK n=1 Tax=Dactylosporangium sp. NPDC051485 TaxID=3154846 RepID=UPI0034161EE2